MDQLPDILQPLEDPCFLARQPFLVFAYGVDIQQRCHDGDGGGGEHKEAGEVGEVSYCGEHGEEAGPGNQDGYRGDLPDAAPAFG